MDGSIGGFELGGVVAKPAEPAGASLSTAKTTEGSKAGHEGTDWPEQPRGPSGDEPASEKQELEEPEAGREDQPEKRSHERLREWGGRVWCWGREMKPDSERSWSLASTLLARA